MIEANMIERRILYKMPEIKVSNEDYANLIAFGLIGRVTESQASKFGFITATGTSPANKIMNDTVMDKASELPTGQPAESQNNNTHLGPRKFTIDFIETKKIDLNKLVDKFNDEDSTIPQ